MKVYQYKEQDIENLLAILDGLKVEGMGQARMLVTAANIVLKATVLEAEDEEKEGT